MVDVRIGDEDGSGDSAYRFGPTRFSVIPRSAVGNVSIRFVPDQNADLLIAALRSATVPQCALSGTTAVPATVADVTTLHAGGYITQDAAKSPRRCLGTSMAKTPSPQIYPLTFPALPTLPALRSAAALP